jgi:hypothetical protein
MYIALSNLISKKMHQMAAKKIRKMQPCETDNNCTIDTNCIYAHCLSETEYRIADHMLEVSKQFYEDLNESIMVCDLIASQHNSHDPHFAKYKHLATEWAKYAKSFLKDCKFITLATISIEPLDKVMNDYTKLRHFNDKKYLELISQVHSHDLKLQQTSKQLFELADHLFHMII